MGKSINLSDKEIDDILATVERSLEQAPQLSKSLKKDDEEAAEEKPEEKPAEEAPAAPAQEAAAEEAPAEAADESSREAAEAADESAEEAEAPAEAEEGEAALESESEDAPLSDEELQQIYGSMPAEELERHYMAIRQHLEQHMGDEAGGEEKAAEAAQAAAPEQAAMKSEEAAKGQSIAKNESSAVVESEEVKALKSEVEKLQKVAETAVKAVELVLQPSRKAVTGIEFIRKNEEMESKSSANEDFSKLSKADIDAKIKQIGPANLSKTERQTVNNFLLTSEGKDKVLDIIKSKGGK